MRRSATIEQRSWRAVLAALVAIALAVLPMAAAAATWAPQEGQELVGREAPELQGLEWLQGGPLSRATLRGKVVLVRFWLVGCPLCTRTLPAFEALWRRDRDRGLVVIGVHHPKSDHSRDLEVVRQAVRELGLGFPIAHDPDWSTVRAYGVGSVFQRYTSLSFLLDRAGRIRFVHDGGELHPGGGPEHRECNAAYESLVEALGQLLAEPPPL